MARTRDLILNYIIEYKAEHGGNSPSYQQIGDAVGKAKSVVSHHIYILCATGYLEHEPGGQRDLVVVKQKAVSPAICAFCGWSGEIEMYEDWVDCPSCHLKQGVSKIDD